MSTPITAVQHMQDNPAKKKPAFRQRACLDCSAVFTPGSGAQKRCPGCRIERNRNLGRESAARLRGTPAVFVATYEERVCRDCTARFRPTINVRTRCQSCDRKHTLELRREARRRRSEGVRRYCADCQSELPREPNRRPTRCPECFVAHRKTRERGRAGEVSGKRGASAVALEPRACPACSAVFQPYRSNQVACSAKCRDALPANRQSGRDSSARFYAKPGSADRANDRRRGTDRVRKSNKRNRLRRYGLTPEMYDAMLAEQHGVCAICGNPPDPNGVGASSKLHVDHDHGTGLVRGLLCTLCNVGLGRFHDDAAQLRRAADYLDHYSELAA